MLVHLMILVVAALTTAILAAHGAYREIARSRRCPIAPGLRKFSTAPLRTRTAEAVARTAEAVPAARIRTCHTYPEAA
ncbi:MAG: hypothetical protein J2P18_12770 [Nocardia sp.]|nr:hypothetical protein [Nocardia sp.]